MNDVLTTLAYLGIPSAITALCFGLMRKHIDKRDKARDEKDAAREKNEILLIKSVGASIALGEATALALLNGKCNGETEAALAYAQQMKHEQKDFLTEQGIKNIY